MKLPGIQFKTPAAVPKATGSPEVAKAYQKLGSDIADSAVMLQQEEIAAGLTRANALTDTDSFETDKVLNEVEYFGGDDIPKGMKSPSGQAIETHNADGTPKDDIPVTQARAGVYQNRMNESVDNHAKNIPNSRERNKWITSEKARIQKKFLVMQTEDISKQRAFNIKEWENITTSMMQQGNWDGVDNALLTYPGDPNKMTEWKVKATKGRTVQELNDILNTDDYAGLQQSYDDLAGTQQEYAKSNKYPELSAKERAAWRKQMKTKLDSQDNFGYADAAVQDAIDTHPDSKVNAMDRLRKTLKNKPAALKVALKLYDSEQSRREKERKEIKTNLIDTSQAVVVDAGRDATLDMVPEVGPYFTQAEHDAMSDQVIQQQKGFSKKSEPGALNTIREMQSEDPAKFVKADLLKYRTKLSEKDYQELYQAQIDAQQGNRDTANAGTTVWNKQSQNWIKSFVNPSDSMAKWSTDDHKKAAMLSELAQADYRRAVLEKGGELTFTERNDILTNLAKVYGETKSSWYNPGDWFSSAPDIEAISSNRRQITRINDNFDSFKMQVPHTAQVQQILSSIDPERMKRIEDRRRANGMTLDKSTMMAEYLRDYNRMYPITGFKDDNEYR